MAREAILDVSFYNKSFKYILLVILSLFVLKIIIDMIKIVFNLNWVMTSIFSFLSGIMIALMLMVIFRIRKTFD